LTEAPPFDGYTIESNEPTFDDSILMHQLDISRRTVESLDRSMTRIRQLNFVILSIIIAGVINLVQGLSVEAGFLILQGTTVLMFIVSMTLWLLDSHYHRYLRSVIKTCVNIERRLGFNLKNAYGMTIGMEHVRKNSQGGKSIPALLYMIMPMTAMLVMVIFAQAYYRSFGFDDVYMTGILALFGIVLIFKLWAEKLESYMNED